MSNPYLDRRGSTIGRSGRRSEDRLAKKLQGRQRPASGAMVGAKGDIDLGTALVEAKSTTADSMTIQLDWLAKITREARAEGKTPVLTVSFVDRDGKPRAFGEWALVRLTDLVREDDP